MTPKTTGLAQLRSLLDLKLYRAHCSPVRAPGQLPLDSTQFDVAFPASQTAVSCGGVSLNAVKYFQKSKNTAFPVIRAVSAIEARQGVHVETDNSRETW